MKPTVKVGSLLLAVLMLFSVFASGCTLNKEWSYKTKDEELAIGVYLTAMRLAYAEAQSYASKLDDYDASSKDWLDLEITDDDGNTAVARDWIKDTAKKRCLEFLAINAQMKELGATYDEATLKQANDQAESYWYQSFKKELYSKGVSMESFKKFGGEYEVKKSALFEFFYFKGGSKEVKVDEITKYFEENYIYYSYLPVSLYEATTDEAGEAKNALSDEKVKEITNTIEGYAKQVNAAADANAANDLSASLVNQYLTANGLEQSAVQSNTALQKKASISITSAYSSSEVKEATEALKELGEGKAAAVKVGEGSSAKIYYVFRHSTKAAKENYLKDDSQHNEIITAMKTKEYEDYLADVIEDIGYEKSEYVGKYNPEMFFKKPENTANNIVTA